MPGPMPKFTKTPPALVAAFERAKPERPDVERRTMFGYPAFFVNGNMFAFTFGPKVAVRLGEAARARAAKAGATPFEVMPGRAMKDYVAVPAPATTGAALRRWVADGLAHAETLPKKTTKKAAAKKTTARKSAKGR
jgi:TfoX/Sxy family transcriptional regulator of competence genes